MRHFSRIAYKFSGTFPGGHRIQLSVTDSAFSEILTPSYGLFTDNESFFFVSFSLSLEKRARLRMRRLPHLIKE